MAMNQHVDPEKARKFAERVVCRLRAAGHEALWAGGCVRDQLLGRVPHDYDVATSARPDEIRRCFTRRRTLPIGAAFGVITVLGNRGEGQIEVATFRKDMEYSDGRHPDAVVYSTAEQDAQRRDFTINGLFLDPLTNTVVDYVGGQADLRAGIVRAIGDPAERFSEDRLRMLRAARFAATFDFDIARGTRAAVVANATEIRVVSAERIAAELRRMLVHENRAVAVRLLRELALLPVILPESRNILDTDENDVGRVWTFTQSLLEALVAPPFPVGLAALLHAICQHSADVPTIVNGIAQRWRLANRETACARWILGHEHLIRTALQQSWPLLQRVLIAPYADELLQFAQAVATVKRESLDGIVFCRDKRALPDDELNPPPLVTGNDLRQAGVPPGPVFRTILTQVRDQQLLGRLVNQQAALQMALALAHQCDTDGQPYRE